MTDAPIDRLRRVLAARGLFFLSAIFIVYATTIPFHFDRAPSLDRAERFPIWNPSTHRFHSFPDMVQNVALFLPFGFFGLLGLRRLREGSVVVGALTLGALGCALSTFVEGLQTMSDVRSPSATDIATNTAGACIGAVAAALFARRFEPVIGRTLEGLARRSPGLIVVAAAAIATFLELLAPFIPSLDVGMLRARARSMIDHPFGVARLGNLPFPALAFAGLAFVAAFEVPPVFFRRGERASARSDGLARAASAGLGVSAYAVLLELAQTPLVHHSPGLREAIVNSAGAWIGVVTATLVARGQLRPAAKLGDHCRRWPSLALGFGVAFPAARALAPFEFRSLQTGLDRLSVRALFPFWTLFETLKMSTFLNTFEAASAYVPLGFILRALGARRWVAFAWALVLAEVMEALQLGIVGRTTDVTEGILAAVGAVLGAYAFDRLTLLAASVSGTVSGPDKSGAQL